MIRKAIKKPVEIEYITFKDLKFFWNEDHRENAHFGFKPVIGEKLKETGNGKNLHYDKKEDIFKIKTLEGTYNMTDKDYLIIGVQGEIYPCKIDIFEETYDVIK